MCASMPQFPTGELLTSSFQRLPYASRIFRARVNTEDSYFVLDRDLDVHMEMETSEVRNWLIS